MSGLIQGLFGGGQRPQQQETLAPLPVAPSRRSAQDTDQLAADQRRRFFGRTETPTAQGAAAVTPTSAAVRFLGGAAKT